MGGSLNICAFLVGLAAFARWMLFRSAVSQRMGGFNLLGGLGILALFFSIVSPDDDAFQQELIRPSIPSVRASTHPRVAPRRSLADLSINAFVSSGDPIQALRTGRLVVMDQPLDHLTHFQGPISIHSPPVAS